MVFLEQESEVYKAIVYMAGRVLFYPKRDSRPSLPRLGEHNFRNVVTEAVSELLCDFGAPNKFKRSLRSVSIHNRRTVWRLKTIATQTIKTKPREGECSTRKDVLQEFSGVINCSKRRKPVPRAVPSYDLDIPPLSYMPPRTSHVLEWRNMPDVALGILSTNQYMLLN